jgi:hypothetical protein
VSLGSPSGASLGDATGALTILDDDASADNSITIGDVSVVEGNVGNHNATFVVRLGGPQPTAVSVSYATSSGSASTLSDYTPKSGTLTIPAGAVSATIKVPVVADGRHEGNESFRVVLSSPTNGAILRRSFGTATIVDDEPESFGRVSMSAIDVPEGDAGNAVVKGVVTMTQPQSAAVTVNVYAAAIGTATAADFTPFAPKTVTIPAGATSASFTVTIKGDVIAEGDEDFYMLISAVSAGAVTDGASGDWIILDDD